jgi:hypothetical protein
MPSLQCWLSVESRWPAAQVGASAAAGALAASHINALLATAGTDAALAALQSGTATA